MFYPPKGCLLADSCRGPIVEAFQFGGGFLPKECLKMFYPPKGRLLADSCRGPIVFTYVLFWVNKTLEAFQFRDGFLPKKIPENVLSPEGTSACRLL